MEIHFFTDRYVMQSCWMPGIRLCVDWVMTEKSINSRFPKIYTTQMSFMNLRLIEKGYRIFIRDETGCFEITLGNCARTDKEIRPTHNIFKMWEAGVFTRIKEE